MAFDLYDQHFQSKARKLTSCNCAIEVYEAFFVLANAHGQVTELAYELPRDCCILFVQLQLQATNHHGPGCIA